MRRDIECRRLGRREKARRVYRLLHPRAPLIELEEVLRAITQRVRELGAELDCGTPGRSLRSEIRRAIALQTDYRRWSERLLQTALADGALPLLALRPADGIAVPCHDTSNNVPDTWPRAVEQACCIAWLGGLVLADLQAVIEMVACERASAVEASGQSAPQEEIDTLDAVLEAAPVPSKKIGRPRIPMPPEVKERFLTQMETDPDIPLNAQLQMLAKLWLEAVPGLKLSRDTLERRRSDILGLPQRKG